MYNKHTRLFDKIIIKNDLNNFIYICSSVKTMQGGLLWYFHTYVGSGIFFSGGGGGGGGGGVKLRISIFMRFSEKMNVFGGMKILWIFF